MREKVTKATWEKHTYIEGKKPTLATSMVQELKKEFE